MESVDSQENFDTGYGTREDISRQQDNMSGYPGGFVAPPPYHAAIDGSDRAVPVSGGRGTMEEPGIEKGGHWLRKRYSSNN